MLCDVEWSPLSQRARLLGAARLKSQQETGERKIYLANITDEVDRLIDLHDMAVEAGANAVMVNGMTTGLSAVRMLRKLSIRLREADGTLENTTQDTAAIVSQGEADKSASRIGIRMGASFAN